MRNSPRIPVDLPVTLDAYGQTSSGRAKNLGLEGVFISLESPPPANAVVNLRFDMPLLFQDLELLARVVRFEPNGIGAEFLDVDVHSRSRLFDFLTSLRPRPLTVCPFCGLELPRPNRKTCPGCRRSLDWRKNESIKESDTGEMVGTCKAMRDVFCLIRKVSVTDVPVLITGANGTGKGMVARAIHRHSNWSQGPFVEVHCGIISKDLLESELFGHERGTFTGASRTLIGHLEQAQGGTLFLDEVGELSADLQVKLLRFLQEFTFRRVGGRQPIKVQVRIISATKTSLKELIEAGRFREDLYYRLNVININLPPLQNREYDSLIMANVFLKRYAARLGKDIKGFTPEAVAVIQGHFWPGNVRELINRVRRAVVMTEDSQVTPAHLGLDQSRQGPESVFNGKSLKEARAEFEARLVGEALHYFRGNVNMASQALEVSRSTMYHFIQKYQLKPYVKMKAPTAERD